MYQNVDASLFEIRRLTKWQHINRIEVKIADAKKHIIEKILTLFCPRCGQAFVDFSGCCALTCSRQGCACAFCAYCLEDCGADAHAHVSSQHGDLFLRVELFEEHHKTRKRALIQTYLEDELDLKLKIVDACERELRDNQLWPL